MELTLRIAGEIVPVLFDGERVTSPDFPSEPIDYTSRCGVRITQSMLVEVCKNKTKTKTNEQTN